MNKRNLSSLQCLLVENITLGNAERSALLMAAYEMYQDHREQYRVKEELLEGIITTDYVWAPSPFRGVTFFARFDCAQGEAKIAYVVPDYVLQSPEEEFYAQEVRWARL